MPGENVIKTIVEQTNRVVKGLDLGSSELAHEAKMRIASALILSHGISAAVSDVGPAIKEVAEDLRSIVRAMPDRDMLLGIETALKSLKG